MLMLSWKTFKIEIDIFKILEKMFIWGGGGVNC